MTSNEIRGCIKSVGARSCDVEDGCIILKDTSTGEAYLLDIPAAMVIARGALAFTEALFDLDEPGEIDDEELLRELVIWIGKSVKLHMDVSGESLTITRHE